MASGVELATAWVRLVPTMEGVQGEVAKAFVPAQKEAEDAGDKAGKGFSTKTKAAITTGSAVFVAGVVAGFKGLYEIGDTFDNVTDTIRIGTGAQGDALTGLVDVAKNVGSQVPAEFNKVGSTVADLNTRLGLTGTDLEKVSKQVLEAGRILGEDIDISGTTAAFTAFGIEGADVSGAMDTLFQISQATGVGMNELASTVQMAAPALQNLGFSFEDSAALAGTLDKAGLNTQQVMASLSKGLVTLAKDGEAPQDAFKRVTTELQGFVDTGDTASALDLASQVFGTRGASQFVGALQAGTLNMEDLMGATGATADTILGVGAETQDFAEKAQILGNQAMLALEPLATSVFQVMGDVLTAIMPAFQAFGSWMAENQAVVMAIAIAIGVLTVAIIAANAAMWLMALNPVVLLIIAIVAAVVALVVAIVWLISNWEMVVAWLNDIWSAVCDWFAGTLEAIGKWWVDMWTEVGNFFRDIWNAIASFFTGIWNGIVRTITNVMNGITSVIDTALNWISGVWNGMWDGMVSFFGDIFGGIVGIAKGPINGVISLVNGAIRALNGFKVTVPDWVPLIGGQTFGFSIPTLPMLATGGTITGAGHVIVGENGPEVLKLPKGAQVNPNFDDFETGGGFTFNNYAPLGSTPSQELETFSNRAKGFMP